MKKQHILFTFLILFFFNQLALGGENGNKYVFIDGTFDLAHYGHQQVIQNAISTGSKFFKVPKDQIKVIVGISGTDEELTTYKRKPVYSIEQKMRQVNGFKGVYKVLNTPMITTKEFIEKHKIDLVVAGGDYMNPVVARKYYKDPIDMGIFVTFPRTEGVSTTNIMRKVVDSITGAPLNPDVYLGNDGYCYDHKSLCKFTFSLKEEFRNRSPFSLDRIPDKDFVVVSHSLASYMVEWLIKEGKMLPTSEEVENAYDELVDNYGKSLVEKILPTKDNLPSLPRTYRLIRLKQQQRLRNQQNVITQGFSAALEKEKEIVVAEINNELDSIVHKVKTIADTAFEKLDHIETKNQEIAQKAISSIEKIDQQIEATNDELSVLKENINQVNSGIVQAKKEQAELVPEIEKLEATIRERKKKRKKHLWKTAAIIGACITGTFLLRESAVVIFPQDGGASLAISISL